MWLTTTDIPCLHCGAQIRCRPCTIGISQTLRGIIRTRGLFCNWFCARTYLNETGLCRDDNVMRCTNKIFKDFMSKPDDDDDIEIIDLLTKYDDIYQVPQIAERHDLARWGGVIADCDKLKAIKDKPSVMLSSERIGNTFFKKINRL